MKPGSFTKKFVNLYILSQVWLGIAHSSIYFKRLRIAAINIEQKRQNTLLVKEPSLKSLLYFSIYYCGGNRNKLSIKNLTRYLSRLMCVYLTLWWSLSNKAFFYPLGTAKNTEKKSIKKPSFKFKFFETTNNIVFHMSSQHIWKII